MAGIYLEQFIESIQTLPCDLKRNLTLVRDLDNKVQDLVNDINQQSDEYIKNANDLTPEEKCKLYNQILLQFDKAQIFSDDKKELAHQTYNMIDKHIRRLDTELSKFDIDIDDSLENIKDLKKHSIKAIKRIKSNSISQKIQTKVDMNKNSRKSKSSEANQNIESSKKKILPTTDLLDMEVDPNEPLYCICHQVSFGEMVGCDDTDCPIEWFHFQCVGLTSKPKGKWYCPQCTLKKKNKPAP